MRIVQLLGPSSGGIGTHVAHLSAGLRRAGDRVVVVAPAATIEAFGADVLGDSRAWWPLERPAGAALEAARELPRLRALVSAADVVHAHGHRAGGVATALLAGRRRRPRLVVSWHNAPLPPRGNLREVSAPRRAPNLTKIPHGDAAWGEWAQRWVARRADLVTGASSDLVAQARSHGAARAALAPVPSPRVPALLAGPVADAEDRRADAARLLHEAGVPGGGLPLVVTVCRVAPQKGLDVLVEAAALLRDACTWVVVGSGDPALERRLRDQAARRRAPVHFVGHRVDVEDWLRAAEVFALTSRWEARALVVQEAMAAGTPVVATDVGGLHDLLASQGSLVPVGDENAVARAVRRLLDDPVLRADRSARARLEAARLPGLDDTVAMWRGWYAEPPSMT